MQCSLTLKCINIPQRVFNLSHLSSNWKDAHSRRDLFPIRKQNHSTTKKKKPEINYFYLIVDG